MHPCVVSYKALVLFLLHCFLYPSLSAIYIEIQVTTVEIMEGDTVVMGSDGLFDNVFAREIISVVGSYNNSADAGI